MATLDRGRTPSNLTMFGWRYWRSSPSAESSHRMSIALLCVKCWQPTIFTATSIAPANNEGGEDRMSNKRTRKQSLADDRQGAPPPSTTIRPRRTQLEPVTTFAGASTLRSSTRVKSTTCTRSSRSPAIELISGVAPKWPPWARKGDRRDQRLRRSLTFRTHVTTIV